MPRYQRFLFNILIFICFFESVRAEDSLENVYHTPQVDVSGVEDSQKELASTSSIMIDLDDYTGKIQTITEVLNLQPGVRILSLGSDAEGSEISLRGSFHDEVNVYLDGVLLNNSKLGGVNLSYYLIKNLKSIEIFKGSSPYFLGFPNSGGAIFLKSRKLPLHEKEFYQSFSGGSFGTFSSNSSYLSRSDHWSSNIAFDFNYSKGNYKFLDDNGTPVFSGDDEIQEKTNNYSQYFHLQSGFSYIFDKKTEVSSQLHFIQKHKGISGLTTNQSDQAKSSYREILLNLTWNRDDFLFNNLEYEHIFYFKWSKSQFSDFEGDIGLGGFQDNDDDTILFGNRVNLKKKINSFLEAHFFTEFQVEDFSPQNYLSYQIATQSSHRKKFLLGLSKKFSFINSKLKLDTSIWGEFVKNDINDSDPSLSQNLNFSNTNFDENISGLIALKYEVSSFINFQTHFSRGHRYPHFSELFGDRGDVVGNPFLTPQKTSHFDIGLYFSKKWKDNLLNFGIEGYYKKIDDLIQFVHKGNYVRSENIGEAEMKGVELNLSYDFLKHMMISSNYSYLDALDQSGSITRNLVGRPMHQVGGEVQYYTDKFKVFTQLDWVDDYFLDELNTLRVDDKLNLTIGLNYIFSKKIEASIKAENLTNEQTVDKLGFPLPGRGYYGRVDFRL